MRLTGCSGQSGAGPFFHVTLDVEDEVVVSCSYQSVDCVFANATGMMLKSLIERSSLARIRQFTDRDLVDRLSDIPSHKATFIGHAWRALTAALQSQQVPIASSTLQGEGSSP
jgi:hypothetical protein